MNPYGNPYVVDSLFRMMEVTDITMGLMLEEDSPTATKESIINHMAQAQPTITTDKEATDTTTIQTVVQMTVALAWLLPAAPAACLAAASDDCISL